MSDNGLAPNRWQAIIWTKDGIVNWRIYASLGLNESNRIMVQLNFLYVLLFIKVKRLEFEWKIASTWAIKYLQSC